MGSGSTIEEVLREVFDLNRLQPEQQQALREAEEAVVEVLARRRPVELSPQAPSVRRLQHQLASAYGLDSQSVGREPFRHLVIRPARRCLARRPIGAARRWTASGCSSTRWPWT